MDGRFEGTVLWNRNFEELKPHAFVGTRLAHRRDTLLAVTGFDVTILSGSIDV